MKRRRIGEGMNYDVLIIGAGPGGIFSAYELIKQDPNLRVGVFEAGHALGGRKSSPVSDVRPVRS